MKKRDILNSQESRSFLLKDLLQRKEKYISENPQYRQWEGMYHKHTVGRYIGDFIYGANDGLITTFAIVAGSVGASLSPTVIIILGFANILADGISMGASNYLGARSEKDYAKAQREKEEWEVEHLRDIEVDEIREIFEKKGFGGRDLERAVAIVTADKKVWVDMMMREELDIIEDPKDDPKKHGMMTFAAFVVAGILPLFPYLVLASNNFMASVIVGLIALFVIGGSRTFVTAVSFIRGGVEMFLIGSTAAGAAYIVGYLIEKMVR